MMQAVVLEEYGSVEVLRIRSVPRPVPKSNEVLIKVAATALNRADLLQRRGLYPGPNAEYEIPGLEFSGTIESVGANASFYQKGTEVMGIVSGGGYAEYLTVEERQVIPVPSNIQLVEAAAIPEVWITAFDALIDKGFLRGGQRCLIHAGGSGVGTAGIQIAKEVGAEVAVTASSSKLDTCTRLGADLVIDYHTEDFVEEIKNWTGTKGVDVILDVIGGDYLEKNIRCMSNKGTIVQVGALKAMKTEINLGALLQKRLTLVGTVLRSRSTEEKIALAKLFISQIVPKFEKGIFKPVIDSRYSFSEIALAHTYMESNKNIGKILIELS
jgi:putative PIG3 family NAD(P)H quinone oxidoreductase